MSYPSSLTNCISVEVLSHDDAIKDKVYPYEIKSISEDGNKIITTDGRTHCIDSQSAGYMKIITYQGAAIDRKELKIGDMIWFLDEDYVLVTCLADEVAEILA